MFSCRYCNCVYMSRRLWFYVCMFFYMYAVESMYICLNVFVFMYLYACKSDERGREKSLEEGKLIA